MNKIRLFAIALSLIGAVEVEGSGRRSFRSCHSAPVVVKKVFVPSVVERIIEFPVTQNIYYSAGEAIRNYAVTPPNLLLAQYGQMQRQLERMQDMMAFNRQQFLQPYPQMPMMQYPPQQQFAAPPQQDYYDLPAPQQSYAPPQQQRVAPQYAPPQQQRAAPPQYDDYAPPQQFAAPPQQLSTCPGPQTQSNPYDYGQAVQQRVTDQRCVGCHNAHKAEGDLNMQGPRTFNQRVLGLQKAMSGEMPKDGQPLTDEELRRFIHEEFSPEEQQALERAFNNGGGQTPPQTNGGGQMPPPEQ